MKDEKCTIVENLHIRKNYYLLKIKTDTIAAAARPGNFVMMAVSNTSEPLLKRPFGILDAEPPFISIYYESVGRGTALMASLKPGDPTHVLGPLGNAFPALEGKNILLVAGGRGIAPLYYAMGDYTAKNNVYLIYGARSGDDLNLTDRIDAMPLKQTFLYTDDGSKGKKGFVTTDIREIIEKHRIDVTISCGPDAMFHALAKTIRTMNTDNYVSLEALMGCGFGICYSCAVKTTDNTYKKVCSDGPIFNMEAIAW